MISLPGLLRALAELLERLPAHSFATLLAVLLPLAALQLYRRFLHVPVAERAVKFSWTAPAEATPGWRGNALKKASIRSHLDDPALVPAGSPVRDYITAYAPGSGYFLSVVPAATRNEIAECITQAQIAQFKWRDTTFAQRRRVMRSLLDWVVAEQEGISRVASRDTGKTMVDAAFGEILTTAEKLRWVIAYGESHLSPESRPTNLLLAHKQSEVHYEPLGVVAAIVSWNYPFHNILSPIIASLFTGNAIVVKPSENVAWSSHHFVTAVREILVACGHSPDLVQIVTCLPAAVEALTGDSRIKHITFIGSEEVGKLVAIKGAETGTPVLLELGGKDACVILPDADLEYFYDTWLRGAFQASGQNCIGIERFLVAEPVYDTFVEAMHFRVARLRQNDILHHRVGFNKTDIERSDVGAMVTDRFFDRLEELIAAAVKDGARLLAGGKRWTNPNLPEGHYFTPTLLVDVTPEMAIAQQEVFAPVMTVMKFETMNEAISIANGTRYGLGASVFGRSKEDCLYVARRLKAGMVCTNDFGVFYLNQSLPFGGVDASGHGRFSGPEGLRGLCSPKAITTDRLHGSLQTSIPPLLAYPIKDGDAAWQFVGGLVELAYGATLAGRGKGLWNLVLAKE